MFSGDSLKEVKTTFKLFKCVFLLLNLLVVVSLK